MEVLFLFCYIGFVTTDSVKVFRKIYNADLSAEDAGFESRNVQMLALVQ